MELSNMDRNKQTYYCYDDMPMDRKDKKPLMERKRRARMNESLNELKKLILFISPQLKSKLEKADILEITVHYFKQLVTIHANSLPGLNNLSEINGDAIKHFKSEQKDLNIKEITNFQTPNISSFLSPPSSVSPDNEQQKISTLSFNEETPNSYKNTRKRKRAIEDNGNEKYLHPFSATTKNFHSNNYIHSTTFPPNFFSTSSLTNQEVAKSLIKHQLNEFKYVLEQENKSVVWRPW